MEIKKQIKKLYKSNEIERLVSIRELTAIGDDSLKIIVDAFFDNPEISEPLKKVIIYMTLPRNTSLLCEFLKNKNSDLAIASFEALSLSSDLDCLKCLYEIYNNSWRKELAVKTIGDLGFIEAKKFLEKEIKRLRLVIESGLINEENFDESDIFLFMSMIRSLNQIKVPYHDEVLYDLANYRSDDEYSDDSIIRKKAIMLLGEIPTKNGLSLIQEAIYDEDFEVREDALLSLLLISTPEAMKPLFWITKNDKVSSSNRLFWCLQQWSGEDLKSLEAYKNWWSDNKSSFRPNNCYKYGYLLDVNKLIDNLNGGSTELEYKLRELKLYVGIDFSICLYNGTETDFIQKVRNLWQKKGFNFNIGNHYRYGHQIQPTLI